MRQIESAICRDDYYYHSALLGICDQIWPIHVVVRKIVTYFTQ